MEEAIKSLIVLGNTGIEVLDEMFICRLNGDKSSGRLATLLLPRTVGALENLEVPNCTNLQAQRQVLLIAAGMEKGPCAKWGKKKPQKSS